MTRAGGCDRAEFATCIFPSAVGRPKSSCLVVGAGYKDKYVGQEFIDKRGILLETPVFDNNGFVKDWDSFESLIHQAYYYEMRLAPEDQACLMLEPLLNPLENRAKMIQIMFETYNVPSLYMTLGALMTMHALNQDTGIVLHAGHSQTYAIPVMKNVICGPGSKLLGFNGRDANQLLIDLMTHRGYYMYMTFDERYTVQQVKEQISFVSQDLKSDLNTCTVSSSLEKSFELPDGNVITLGSERFECLEPFFTPSLYCEEKRTSIVDLVNDSIVTVRN